MWTSSILLDNLKQTLQKSLALLGILIALELDIFHANTAGSHPPVVTLTLKMPSSEVLRPSRYRKSIRGQQQPLFRYLLQSLIMLLSDLKVTTTLAWNKII